MFQQATLSRFLSNLGNVTSSGVVTPLDFRMLINKAVVVWRQATPVFVQFAFILFLLFIQSLAKCYFVCHNFDLSIVPRHGCKIMCINGYIKFLNEKILFALT